MIYKNYEEYLKSFKRKEDIIHKAVEQNELCLAFEKFVKLKYGDDFMDGWLYYLRTGELPE